MSTIHVVLKVFVISGALLAASATQASDVTSDRHEALQETSRGVEQGASAKGQESSGPRSNATHPCTCSRAGAMKGASSGDEAGELDRLRSQGG